MCKLKFNHWYRTHLNHTCAFSYGFKISFKPWENNSVRYVYLVLRKNIDIISNTVALNVTKLLFYGEIIDIQHCISLKYTA